MKSRTLLFALGIIGCRTVCLGAPPIPPIDLTIKDLTPEFLKFYEEAISENASPDRRWALWKQDYDFAAVPPTPEGDTIARKLLDAAWPRYPEIIGIVRIGAKGLTPDPHKTIESIAGLLQATRAVNVTLVVYVGCFEGNAFTAADKGEIMTALPIEGDEATRALRMTHELTHAVHISMGSFSGSWIRTIGTTVLTEGLAMRATQALIPGHPDAYYVEAESGWFGRAVTMRSAILNDLLPYLKSDRTEDVMRFTMGNGPSGINREAYYAGWLVVGYWLEHGKSFADIARIQEKEMPLEVGKAIEEIIAERK